MMNDTNVVLYKIACLPSGFKVFSSPWQHAVTRDHPVLPLLFPREFAKEKDRVESRAAFLHKKMVQRLDLEIDGYMNWICKAGKKEREQLRKRRKKERSC